MPMLTKSLSPHRPKRSPQRSAAPNPGGNGDEGRSIATADAGVSPSRTRPPQLQRRRITHPSSIASAVEDHVQRSPLTAHRSVLSPHSPLSTSVAVVGLGY